MKYKIVQSKKQFKVYISKYPFIWVSLYKYGDDLARKMELPRDFCIRFPTKEQALTEIEKYVKLLQTYKHYRARSVIVGKGKIDENFKFISLL